jgi:methanogenic corrinoid protein MtbC1
VSRLEPVAAGGYLDTYLALLAEADEDGAIGLAVDLLDRGVPAERLLLDVVAPAQVEVGVRWQRNEWNVAQEHAATHISERVVAAVSAQVRPRATAGRVVVACVDGEWHALPARLLAEVLRLNGWKVSFLGASVPAPHLVSYLRQHGPDAVAVSCALPTRLPVARRLIAAAKAVDVPVLAGGRGFGPGARWAGRLGADRWAATAPEAVRALADWPPPATTPAPPVSTDDEDALITRRRQELVDGALDALAEHFPPLRDYTAPQRDATLDDLGHIVDFLAASVLVDDPTLFTDFIHWLALVLRSRHVPPTSVDVALAALAATLYDFPRARTTLATARAVLPGL